MIMLRASTLVESKTERLNPERVMISDFVSATQHKHRLALQLVLSFTVLVHYVYASLYRVRHSEATPMQFPHQRIFRS